jgi:hypothetical protein
MMTKNRYSEKYKTRAVSSFVSFYSLIGVWKKVIINIYFSQRERKMLSKHACYYEKKAVKQKGYGGISRFRLRLQIIEKKEVGT